MNKKVISIIMWILLVLNSLLVLNMFWYLDFAGVYGAVGIIIYFLLFIGGMIGIRKYFKASVPNEKQFFTYLSLVIIMTVLIFSNTNEIVSASVDAKNKQMFQEWDEWHENEKAIIEELRPVAKIGNIAPVEVAP